MGWRLWRWKLQPRLVNQSIGILVFSRKNGRWVKCRRQTVCPSGGAPLAVTGPGGRPSKFFNGPQDQDHQQTWQSLPSRDPEHLHLCIKKAVDRWPQIIIRNLSFQFLIRCCAARAASSAAENTPRRGRKNRKRGQTFRRPWTWRKRKPPGRQIRAKRWRRRKSCRIKILWDMNMLTIFFCGGAAIALQSEHGAEQPTEM